MMIDLRHEHEIDTAIRERKLVRRRALEFDHSGCGGAKYAAFNRLGGKSRQTDSPIHAS